METQAPTTQTAEHQDFLIAHIRGSLRGQARAAQMEEARLRYRTLPYREIRAKIKASLPPSLFRWRSVHAWEIGDYTRPIPDAVLLKYAEARDSGLFMGFYVLESSYERQMPAVRSDPWLIGKVFGAYSTILEGADRVAIIAYWA